LNPIRCFPLYCIIYPALSGAVLYNIMAESQYPVPKALLFDVFGTVVIWRATIETALKNACAHQLSLPPPHAEVDSSPLTQYDILRRIDALKTALHLPANFWEDFVQQWRNSYMAFTRSFPGPETRNSGFYQEWISIDAFHYSALVTLLHQKGLTGLFPPETLTSLTLAWHRLPLETEAAAGIQALNKLEISTCTLGNANKALLQDLIRSNNAPFHRTFSAEDFHAYKTNPATYLGACKKLGLEPKDVGMVASHMGDLMAARECGLMTFYVERKGEEAWSKEIIKGIVEKGQVTDTVWLGEGGFEELARRFASKVDESRGYHLR
jgi:2-haloacid dehalogenase